MTSKKSKLSGAECRKKRKVFMADVEKSKSFMSKFLKQPDSAQDIEKDADTDIHSTQQPQQQIQQPGPLDVKMQSGEGDTEVEIVELATISRISVSEESSSQQKMSDDPIIVLRQKPSILTSQVILNHDMGYLQFDAISNVPLITKEFRNDLLTRGSTEFQNNASQFSSTDGRSMTSSWFQRRLSNGQEINRSWLLYSPVKEAAYCFCCLLFPSAPTNQRSEFTLPYAFFEWRHTERLREHESNPHHREAFGLWKEAERRALSSKTVCDELNVLISSEKQRWRDILKRILSCKKFLATQNLAFRGHDEHIYGNSTSNPGNFLALMQLLGQYDPVLRNHLEHCKQASYGTSYLSPAIQNEFIDILASTVKERILDDIKRNKYYGIILDSTPDMAHKEQLSHVVRYVDVNFNTKTVKIRESFFGFIELQGKDAETLETVIVKKLQADQLPLKDCRSQCYDNAPVMRLQDSKREFKRGILKLYLLTVTTIT